MSFSPLLFRDRAPPRNPSLTTPPRSGTTSLSSYPMPLESRAGSALGLDTPTTALGSRTPVALECVDGVRRPDSLAGREDSLAGREGAAPSGAAPSGAAPSGAAPSERPTRGAAAAKGEGSGRHCATAADTAASDTAADDTAADDTAAADTAAAGTVAAGGASTAADVSCAADVSDRWSCATASDRWSSVGGD
eukprot:scaffold111047_cov48-Phaeocystis_antarctica.AAC.1